MGKKQKKVSNMRKRLLSVVLAVGMMALLLPTEAFGVSGADGSATLANPQIQKDSSMAAGQKVTWNCVEFGSYPQAEVITQEMSEKYPESILNEDDYIISDGDYSALEGASWNADNEATVGGAKYRRVRKEDATYVSSTDRYQFDWDGDKVWHYFKYEPIKWRILEVSGNKALLLSDKVLDDRRYHENPVPITWERSTMRSWLNGYSAKENLQGADYAGKGFIDRAFSASEKGAIVKSKLKNPGNDKTEISGGNDTEDYVFLLSEQEMWSTAWAASYGFVKDRTVADEARIAKASTYAKAMGVYVRSQAGNCWWWLRTPGDIGAKVLEVKYDGSYGGRYGDHVASNNVGVRAALYLNTGASGAYSMAGTVVSEKLAGQGGTNKPPATDTTGTETESETETETETETESETESETQKPSQREPIKFTWLSKPPIKGMEGQTITFICSLGLDPQGPTSKQILEEVVGRITWESSDESVGEVSGCSIRTRDNITASLYVNVICHKAGTITVTGTTSNNMSLSCEAAITGTTTKAQQVKTPATTKAAPSAGQIITDSASDGKYKVLTASSVEYVKPLNTDVSAAAIPATVKIEGKSYQVTSVAARAFYKCTELKKVTIPSGVSKIGSQAFTGCRRLKNITIKSRKLTKKSVGKKAFKGVRGKAVVKVPKGKLKAYKKLLTARGAGKNVKVKK